MFSMVLCIPFSLQLTSIQKDPSTYYLTRKRFCSPLQRKKYYADCDVEGRFVYPSEKHPPLLKPRKQVPRTKKRMPQRCFHRSAQFRQIRFVQFANWSEAEADRKIPLYLLPHSEAICQGEVMQIFYEQCRRIKRAGHTEMHKAQRVRATRRRLCGFLCTRLSETIAGQYFARGNMFCLLQR